MLTFSAAWAEAVLAECRPIFEAADVGFDVGRLLRRGPENTVVALLWRTERQRMADQYPESGLAGHFDVEGFGPEDNLTFWVTPAAPDRVRFNLEGCWNIADLQLGLDGDGSGDGQAIADVFARLLAVTSPRVDA